MTRTLYVAATALAAAMPRVAVAQVPAELRLGETITGALTAAEPAMRDAGRFTVYRVQLPAGQRFVATMRSDAFDALLTLLRPVGGITEPLARDDDGGGGSDARLRFSVPEPGTYLLVAQSYGADGVGGYTLSLEEAPPARPATPQPIAVGESRQGRLSEDGPFLYDDADNDVLYHLYTFDATAGQDVAILLESDDFDAFLSFGRLNGSELDITASDDDGGGNTNARVRVTIPANGRYGFHARALSSGTGSYTVSVREVSVEAPQPLAAGRDIRGSLGAGDADGDNRFYNRWLYGGAAGERISVRMRSDDFDTYLVLGHVVDGEVQELASNDDEGDDGTNSYLEFVLPAAGDYLIRATSFSSGRTGSYTLRLDSARP
jgi:hypothetical protein